jgi:hypothetical protein
MGSVRLKKIEVLVEHLHEEFCLFYGFIRSPRRSYPVSTQV